MTVTGGSIYSRTSALPHFRTPALPHSRTPLRLAPGAPPNDYLRISRSGPSPRAFARPPHETAHRPPRARGAPPGRARGAAAPHHAAELRLVEGQADPRHHRVGRGRGHHEHAADPLVDHHARVHHPA